jgi:hypothetical protein
VLCIPVEYRWSKNQTGCSPGNTPLCGNLDTTGATLSGTPLLQRAGELRRRCLILSRYLPEPPLAEMVLGEELLWSISTKLEQIALREILLLEKIRA